MRTVVQATDIKARSISIGAQAFSEQTHDQ